MDFHFFSREFAIFKILIFDKCHLHQHHQHHTQRDKPFSWTHLHGICVEVDEDKRKGERKKKCTICFGQSGEPAWCPPRYPPRCPPGTCGNPVRSAFDHLVDSRAALPLTYPRKSLPLKITQRAEQTLMPVVNCLKAPGRGALGNRLCNLFTASSPTDSPRS